MLDGRTREPNALDTPGGSSGGSSGGCGCNGGGEKPCGCKSAAGRAQPVLDYGEATLRLRVHALTFPSGASVELRAIEVAPCADEPQTDFLGSLVGRLAIDTSVTAPAMRWADAELVVRVFQPAEDGAASSEGTATPRTGGG